MDKFRGKYRIKSARWEKWDYGWNGAYFVTIVTQNRLHYFGRIIDGEMQLSDLGKIAQKFWYEIPVHFPFVVLDAFVVMPNHIHGIIIIDKPVETPDSGVSTGKNMDVYIETPNLGVSTRKNMDAGNDKRWKPGTLGVIVNQYKRACTIEARQIVPDFGWQSRFYDRVIRDGNEFNKIRFYILNNPGNWENDYYS